MRILYYSFFIWLFLSGQIIVLSSCASIAPPTGGPKDTLPPVFIKATPPNFAKRVKTKRYILYFNKFVDTKDLQSNLIVSPNPNVIPTVEHYLHTLTITMKDSLKQNSTYWFNFGNSVVDINEGNILKNFSYVFSTGSSIDSNTLSGKVILAETGDIDSSLIVILHKNLSDSTIRTINPYYYTKLNNKGEFTFKYLAPGVYNIFCLPNDYIKKYTDSTQIFAFNLSPITIIHDSTNSPITLYAYQEYKKVEKTKTATSSTAPNNGSKKSKKTKIDSSYQYTNSLEGQSQDILSNFILTVKNRFIKSWDSTKMALCDTGYNILEDYSIQFDTVTHNTFTVVGPPLAPKTGFKFVFEPDAMKDTLGIPNTRGDTISFTTKTTSDYGSVIINFSGLDSANNNVLQIVKENKIIASAPLSPPDFSFQRTLFYPGSFTVRVLLDVNHSGKWEPGNYKKKIQTEHVIKFKDPLVIKADWDNEVDYNL